MEINKLSGYNEFTLASGRKIAWKLCNATNELYAEMMGFKTLTEIQDSLTLPMVAGIDEEGNPGLVPDYTVAYLANTRKFFYCACKYVCIAQNQPVDFNEWLAGEWLEEIGMHAIASTMEPVPEAILAEEEADAKKKPKKVKKPPIIRATQ